MSGQPRGRTPRRDGHTRRPPLGQHFLRSGALAADIVARTSVAAGDLVVEVGAGLGALTRPLAASGARVLAVELDPGLAARLRRDFATHPRVEVREADFLDLPLPREPYSVLGNIPFSRTAEIVRYVTEAAAPPRDAYLVVQREAALRFAGDPWAPESLRSLMLKPWWHVEVVRTLRRDEFEPPPSVEGALLWLAQRPRPLVAPGDADAYCDFVAYAFARSGASVRDALRPLFTRAQAARLARDLRLNLETLRSDVDFARWLALYRAFAVLATPAVRRRIRGAAARAMR